MNIHIQLTLNNHSELTIHETGSDKKTIIAVHGLTGNHKTFHHYRNLLEDEYNFISYDLRGRGNSSPAKENTSITGHVKDLKALIKDKNIKSPILMGYSMGAYICAQVASEIDISGLILLDGGGKAEERQRDLIIPSLSRLSKVYKSENDYVAHAKSIYESLNVPWDDFVEEITRYEVEQIEGGWQHKSNESSMEKDFASFYDFKPTNVFSQISCPTLLIIANGRLGEKDPLFTKETYIETVQSAENIKIVETDANHYTLVLEKQDKLERSIKDFLAQLN